MFVSRKSKTSTLLNPNLVARAVYAKHSPILALSKYFYGNKDGALAWWQWRNDGNGKDANLWQPRSLRMRSFSSLQRAIRQWFFTQPHLRWHWSWPWWCQRWIIVTVWDQGVPSEACKCQCAWRHSCRRAGSTARNPPSSTSSGSLGSAGRLLSQSWRNNNAVEALSNLVLKNKECFILIFEEAWDHQIWYVLCGKHSNLAIAILTFLCNATYIHL